MKNRNELEIAASANNAFVAIESAKEETSNESDEDILSRLENLVRGIIKGEYKLVEDLRKIIESEEMNSIFSFEVTAGGLSLPLERFLRDLIDAVKTKVSA